MASVPLFSPVSNAPGHPVRLAAPFFAEPQANPSEGGGALLLRYQDPEFIPRFLTELAAGRLSDPAQSSWWREDRFSPHDDRLVLRLPIHRTFYLVVCELSCDRLGAPALDPARVASAGFVVRRQAGAAAPLLTSRGGPLGRLLSRESGDRTLKTQVRELALATEGREQQWTLEEGEPLGWSGVPEGGRDPDLDRRVCANGVGRRQPRPPAYTGEETHPMHPVTARDASGRLHTLLYGFLPLGGQSLAMGSPFDPGDESAAVAAEHARLPWPFGYRGRASRSWRTGDGVQVDAGVPTPACFVLLEVLVNRYHLGEPARAGGDGEGDPLNADLAEQARGLWFREPRFGPRGLGIEDGTPVFALETRGVVRFSLYDYLTACFAAGDANPLIPWLAEQRRAIDAAGGLDSAPDLDPLPARPGDGAADPVAGPRSRRGGRRGMAAAARPAAGGPGPAPGLGDPHPEVPPRPRRPVPGGALRARPGRRRPRAPHLGRGRGPQRALPGRRPLRSGREPTGPDPDARPAGPQARVWPRAPPCWCRRTPRACSIP